MEDYSRSVNNNRNQSRGVRSNQQHLLNSYGNQQLQPTTQNQNKDEIIPFTLPPPNCLIFGNSLIAFFYLTLILILGYFLNAVEANTMCFAKQDSSIPFTEIQYELMTWEERLQTVNVSYRFRQLISMYLVIYGISFVNTLYQIYLIQQKSSQPSIQSQDLQQNENQQNYNQILLENKVEAVNMLFAIVFFVMMCTYRFNHSGRVCSGEYQNQQNDTSIININSNYLIQRGQLLKIMTYIYSAIYGIVAISGAFILLKQLVKPKKRKIGDYRLLDD